MRVVLVVLAAAFLLAPSVSGAMKATGYNARGLFLDKTTLVFDGSGYRPTPWGGKDVVVDLDRDLVAGNLTLPGVASYQLLGRIDPDTYALDAKILKGVWDEKGADWTRKGAFTGTLTGELVDPPPDSVEFAQKRAASEGSVPFTIGWRGTVSVTWSSFEYRQGESTTDPQGTPPVGQAQTDDLSLYLTGQLMSAAAEEKLKARLTKIVGEVEIKRVGEADFSPARVGDELREGDFVSTGFDSTADLEFPYGSVRVTQLTQLRVDEFLRPDKLGKTQVFLRAGSVAVKVKHEGAVRGDFHVPTVGANSAIRDSAMVVTYDETTGTTTVRVTDDKAFVKGANDTAEREVAAGQKSVVDDGVAAAPVAFEASEVPEALRPAAFGAPPAGNGPPADGGDADGGDGTDEGAPPKTPGVGVLALVAVAALVALSRRR